MTIFATVLWTCLGVVIVAGSIALAFARPVKEPPRPPITELPRPEAVAERGAYDALAPHKLSVIVQRRHWVAARRMARRDGITVDDYVAALIDADIARQEQTPPPDSLSGRSPLASRTEGRARPGENSCGEPPSVSQGVPTPTDPLGTECWRGALIAVAEGGSHPGEVEGTVSGLQPVPGPRRDATHLDTGGNAEKMSITTDRQPYRCGDETPHPGPSVSPSRDGGGPGCASKFP